MRRKSLRHILSFITVTVALALLLWLNSPPFRLPDGPMTAYQLGSDAYTEDPARETYLRGWKILDRREDLDAPTADRVRELLGRRQFVGGRRRRVEGTFSHAIGFHIGEGPDAVDVVIVCSKTGQFFRGSSERKWSPTQATIDDLASVYWELFPRAHETRAAAEQKDRDVQRLLRPGARPE